MKAIVKKIKYGTLAEAGGWEDDFVMIDQVGKTISIRPMSHPKWFRDKNGYHYHRSWLKFVKE